jgi:hypothetical protein
MGDLKEEEPAGLAAEDGKDRILRIFREDDAKPILTKVVSSEKIDLRVLAKECNLDPTDEYLYFIGHDTGKVSLPMGDISVKLLLKSCGSEGDLLLYGKHK